MRSAVSKPVVLVCEKLSAATYAVLGDSVEIRFCNGADPNELRTAVADAQALLIRSATQVTADVIAAAPQLRVIARAGIGLDNVDVPAATAAGVMVVNAPTSNITSVAELTIGLMLATARNIAAASSALKAGTWGKSVYGGFELDGKTVGIIGLGRIGSLVAARLRAFGVELIGYDPFASAEHAAALGVRLLALD
ncbi:MAG: phosphoglycerate dehydrogenase, partial [Actinobacteria bacterium]|nr:phosphoglycerate dehydrogenase [Actinomycetota bacterium]